MTDRAIELVRQAQFQLGQAYPDYQVLRTLEELHAYLLGQSAPVVPPVTVEVISESQNTNPGPTVSLEPPPLSFLGATATAEEVKAFVRAKREASLPTGLAPQAPETTSSEPLPSSEPPSSGPSPAPQASKRRGRPPKSNPPGDAVPNI